MTERLRQPWAGRALDLLLALTIFFVALGPRLDAAYAYTEQPQSEEKLYDRYAWPWAQGEGTEPREKAFPWHPLGSFTHRPPLYVLFLGSIYRVAGHDFTAARVVQAYLGALTCLLVFVLGKQVLNRWVGLAAALLMADYSFLINFTPRLMSETLFIFLMLGGLILLLWARGGGLWRYFWAGVGLGLADLTRPVLLLPFLLFVAVWLWFVPRLRWGRTTHDDGRTNSSPAIADHLAASFLKLATVFRLSSASARQALGVLLALVALGLGHLTVIGPVVVRNYQLQGRLVLISSNSGYTFYHGIARTRNLTNPDALPSKESVQDLGLGELDEQKVFRQVALDYLRQYPQDIPAILWAQAEEFLVASQGYKVSDVVIPAPEDPVYWPLIGLGALLSLFLFPRRETHTRALLYSAIVAQILMGLVFHMEVRYRLPLVPLLAVLTFWAVWRALAWLWSLARPTHAPSTARTG